MADPSGRLRLVGIVLVLIAAVAVLLFQFQANNVPANGGGISTSDPQVREELRKHYEDMSQGGRGPAGAPPTGVGATGPGPR